MSDVTRTTDLLDVLAKVLIRCALFGLGLVLLWWGVFKLTDGLLYGLHERLFGLTSHELDVIFYCGIVLTKLAVLLFFFIPWLAIRLVLRSARRRCEREGIEKAAISPTTGGNAGRIVVKQQE
jgi:hypothetical protein